MKAQLYEYGAELELEFQRRRWAFQRAAPLGNSERKQYHVIRIRGEGKLSMIDINGTSVEKYP